MAGCTEYDPATGVANATRCPAPELTTAVKVKAVHPAPPELMFNLGGERAEKFLPEPPPTSATRFPPSVQPEPPLSMRTAEMQPPSLLGHGCAYATLSNGNASVATGLKSV
eukprot:3276193-Rhodomonas_salina.1